MNESKPNAGTPKKASSLHEVDWPRDEAYHALVKTSCRLGHTESEDQILSWMCGVTDEGMESLCAKIIAHRDDVREIRARQRPIEKLNDGCGSAATTQKEETK